tara:strand:+ start:959 stop:1084 length:126 start_codon:yes stop_codon:yes gene_type:complete
METQKEKEQQKTKDNDKRLNIAGIITFLLACLFWIIDRISK